MRDIHAQQHMLLVFSTAQPCLRNAAVKRQILSLPCSMPRGGSHPSLPVLFACATLRRHAARQRTGVVFTPHAPAFSTPSPPSCPRGDRGSAHPPACPARQSFNEERFPVCRRFLLFFPEREGQGNHDVLPRQAGRQQAWRGEPVAVAQQRGRDNACHANAAMP